VRERMRARSAATVPSAPVIPTPSAQQQGWHNLLSASLGR
jgi:hypothetical protein